MNACDEGRSQASFTGVMRARNPSPCRPKAGKSPGEACCTSARQHTRPSLHAHPLHRAMQQQVLPARWNARHDDPRQGLRGLPVSTTTTARHASLSRQTAASVTDSLVAPARLPATNPAGGMDCTQGMATKFMRRWMILVLRSRVLSLRWVS